MKRPETPFRGHDNAAELALYMTMELSDRQWKLGFMDRRHKIRRLMIEARNLGALQEQIGAGEATF